MLLNYKALLLTILLPLNMLHAAQEISAPQQEKKQENQILRKKIYMWAGISAGIIASIVGVVGICFQTQKSSKPVESSPRNMFDYAVPLFTPPISGSSSTSKPEQNIEKERKQEIFKPKKGENSRAALVHEDETPLRSNFAQNTIGYLEQAQTKEQLDEIYNLFVGYGMKEVEQAYLKKKAALEQKKIAHE